MSRKERTEEVKVAKVVYPRQRIHCRGLSLQSYADLELQLDSPTAFDEDARPRLNLPDGRSGRGGGLCQVAGDLCSSMGLDTDARAQAMRAGFGTAAWYAPMDAPEGRVASSPVQPSTSYQQGASIGYLPAPGYQLDDTGADTPELDCRIGRLRPAHVPISHVAEIVQSSMGVPAEGEYPRFSTVCCEAAPSVLQGGHGTPSACAPADGQHEEPAASSGGASTGRRRRMICW